MKSISEINLLRFAEFYSMTDFCNAIRKDIRVCSWGADDWVNVQDIFLRFSVNAQRHKGLIFIGVNGLDLFDVFFTSVDGTITGTLSDIYIDEIIGRIDDVIEYIEDYSF
jgi:hypothetical protein